MDYEICEQTSRKQFGLQEHVHVDVEHILLAQGGQKAASPCCCIYIIQRGAGKLDYMQAKYS